MRAEDFAPDCPGKLVPTTGGLTAFVPAPLPPSIGADWETVGLVAEADHALGRLEGPRESFGTHTCS